MVVSGLPRFGKTFGATAADSQRKAIETTTAMKILVSISGDGIPTSRIQRLTSAEPPHAQPPAAQHSVFVDCFRHIDRARGLETAHWREKRRDESLVAAKNCDGDRSHRRRLSARLLRRSSRALARDRCCNRGTRPRRR